MVTWPWKVKHCNHFVLWEYDCTIDTLNTFAVSATSTGPSGDVTLEWRGCLSVLPQLRRSPLATSGRTRSLWEMILCTSPTVIRLSENWPDVLCQVKIVSSYHTKHETTGNSDTVIANSISRFPSCWSHCVNSFGATFAYYCRDSSLSFLSSFIVMCVMWMFLLSYHWATVPELNWLNWKKLEKYENDIAMLFHVSTCKQRVQ